jgi:hypothetical protein
MTSSPSLELPLMASDQNSSSLCTPMATSIQIVKVEEQGAGLMGVGVRSCDVNQIEPLLFVLT